ncbi:hypothetical protein [Sphingomonas sp. CFBP 8760]|uniref:hypothetical protein n=1 Tax=Sphingomonas sp. CFBP 8760 TaxID=2775282 RepID=UPI00177B1FCC|nr:hypothetical protein [Sphingomonas sp. CFBP 8760]MBD8548530.1 hypothetical protein [Sphingomonas sp. CFBP 8760]
MSSTTMATTPPPTTSKLSSFDRIIMVGGFVLTTVFTSYFGFVAQDRSAECQAIRTQRLADVERFRTVAADFEPLVDDYMGKALHGHNADASKKAVLLNLRQQRTRLAYVTPYLNIDGKETAKRFDDAVVNFVVEAEKNPTGTKLGPLYQELEYIFDNSQSLITASNRATGMDNIQVTTGRFWKRTLTCSES